jgi:hypothetical protein
MWAASTPLLLYSLIGSAKLNGVNPEGYVRALSG